MDLKSRVIVGDINDVPLLLKSESEGVNEATIV